MARAAAGLGALSPLMALANPTGGQVAAGSAHISTPSANTTIIKQSSQNAVINWQQFSVGPDQFVQFLQPDSSAITLNRVIGQNPSSIFGDIRANGQVFLINPNGILFGRGASLDVAGLVASTQGISNSDFMAGRYQFLKGSAAPDASVINQGSITTTPNGYVVLAGDYVENDGILQAQSGRVLLAAGGATTLTLDKAEGLISYSIDGATLAHLAGVRNTGEISAEGGTVIMTADVANALTATAVNNSGFVAARSIQSRDGVIILAAVGGGIDNSGTLDASASQAGVAGGTIIIRGNGVTKLDPTSQIDAAGDGATGGFVELSGHNLSVRGSTELGHGGDLLLDPANLKIVTGSGVAFSPSDNVGSGYIKHQLSLGNNVYLVASKSIGKASNVTNITESSTGQPGKLSLRMGTLTVGAGGSLAGTHCVNAGVCGLGTNVKFTKATGGKINLPGLTIKINGAFEASASHGTVSIGAVTAKTVVIDAPGGTVKLGPVTANSAFPISAATVGGLGAYVNAPSGHVTVAGKIMASHGGVVINGGNVAFGSVSAGGKLSVSAHMPGAATASISVTPGKLLMARSVRLRASGSDGAKIITSAIDAKGGSISIDALANASHATKVSVGSLSAATRVSVQESGGGSGGFITVGNITAGGSVSVRASDANGTGGNVGVGAITGRTIQLTARAKKGADINVAGTLTATASRGQVNISASDASAAANGGNVNVTGNIDALQGHVNIFTHGGGSLGGNLHVGSIDARGAVVINDSYLGAGSGFVAHTGNITATNGFVSVTMTGHDPQFSAGAIAAHGPSSAKPSFFEAGAVPDGFVAVGLNKTGSAAGASGGFIKVNSFVLSAQSDVSFFVKNGNIKFTGASNVIHAIDKVTLTANSISAAGALSMTAHDAGIATASIAVNAASLKAGSVKLVASGSHGGKVTTGNITATGAVTGFPSHSVGGSIDVETVQLVPTLTRRRGTVTTGDLSATGRIEVFGTNISVGGVNAGGEMFLSADGTSARHATVTASKPIVFGAYGSIEAEGPSGSIHVGDVTATNAEVSFFASGAAGHPGKITVGNVTAKNYVAFFANSRSGSVNVGTIKASNSYVSISAAKLTTTGPVTAASYVSFYGGKFTVGGAVTAGAYVQMRGTQINVAGPITAGTQFGVILPGPFHHTPVNTGYVKLFANSAAGRASVNIAGSVSGRTDSITATGGTNADISVGAITATAKTILVKTTAPRGADIRINGPLEAFGAFSTGSNVGMGIVLNAHATGGANSSGGNLRLMNSGSQAVHALAGGVSMIAQGGLDSGGIIQVHGGVVATGNVYISGFNSGSCCGSVSLKNVTGGNSIQLRAGGPGNQLSVGSVHGGSIHVTGAHITMGSVTATKGLSVDAVAGVGSIAKINVASSHALQGRFVSLTATGGSGGSIHVGNVTATGSGGIRIGAQATGLASKTALISAKNITASHGEVLLKAHGNAAKISVGSIDAEYLSGSVFGAGAKFIAKGITATGASSGCSHCEGGSKGFIKFKVAQPAIDTAASISIAGPVKSSHGFVSFSGGGGAAVKVTGNVTAQKSVGITAGDIAVTGSVTATSGSVKLQAALLGGTGGNISAGNIDAGGRVTIHARGAGAAGGNVKVGNISASGGVSIGAQYSGSQTGVFKVQTGTITGEDVLVLMRGRDPVFSAAGIAAFGPSSARYQGRNLCSCEGGPSIGTHHGFIGVKITPAGASGSINVTGPIVSQHGGVIMSASRGAMNVTGNMIVARNVDLAGNSISVAGIKGGSSVVITQAGLSGGVKATGAISASAGSVHITDKGRGGVSVGSVTAKTSAHIQASNFSVGGAGPAITVNGNITAGRVNLTTSVASGGDITVHGGIHANTGNIVVNASGSVGTGGNIQIDNNVRAFAGNVTLSAVGGGASGANITVGNVTAHGSVGIHTRYVPSAGSLHPQATQTAVTTGVIKAGSNILVKMIGPAPHFTAAGMTAGSSSVVVKLTPTGAAASSGVIHVTGPIVASNSSVLLNPGFASGSHTAPHGAGSINTVSIDGKFGIQLTGSAIHVGGLSAANGMVSITGVAANGPTAITVTGPINAQQVNVRETLPKSDSHSGTITLQGNVTATGTIDGGGPGIDVTASHSGSTFGVKMQIGLAGLTAQHGNIHVIQHGQMGGISATGLISAAAGSIQLRANGSAGISVASIKSHFDTSLHVVGSHAGAITVNGNISASGEGVFITDTGAGGNNIHVNGNISVGNTESNEVVNIDASAGTHSGGNVTVGGKITSVTGAVTIDAHGGGKVGGGVNVGSISAHNSVVINANYVGASTGFKVQTGKLTGTYVDVSMTGKAPHLTIAGATADGASSNGSGVHDYVKLQLFPTNPGSGSIHVTGTTKSLHGNVSFDADEGSINVASGVTGKITAANNITIDGGQITLGALSAGGSLFVTAGSNLRAGNLSVVGGISAGFVELTAQDKTGGNVTVSGDIDETTNVRASGSHGIRINAGAASGSGGNISIGGHIVASHFVTLNAHGGGKVGGNIHVGNITVNGSGLSIDASYTGNSPGFTVKTGVLTAGFVNAFMNGHAPLFSAAGIAGKGLSCGCSADVTVTLSSISAPHSGSIHLTGAVTATRGGVKLDAGYGALSMGANAIDASGSFGNVRLFGSKLSLANITASGFLEVSAAGRVSHQASITAAPATLWKAERVAITLEGSGITGGKLAIGAVQATGGGTNASSGVINIHDAGSVGSGSVIVATHALTAAKSIAVHITDSVGGSMVLGALQAPSVKVSLTKGNIQVGDITANAGGESIDAASGSLTVLANGNETLNGGVLKATGAMHVHATGSLALNNVSLTDSAFSASAGRNLTVATTGSLNLVGQKAVAGKALTLTAGGALKLGNATVGGSVVNITATSITNSSAAGSLTAGGGTIKATSGNIDLKNETLNLTAGAGPLLSAHGSVNLAAVTASGAGNLGVHAGTNVNATSITFNAGTLQVTAGGKLTLTSATVNAAGGIDLHANSMALGGAILQAGKALDLHVTKALSLAHATFSGSAVSASAGGNITNSGAAVTLDARSGALTLKSGGNLSLGGETLHVGGAATLTAAGSLDLTNTTLIAGGAVTLQGATLAEDLAHLTAAGALTETGGSVDLTSATLKAGKALDLHATRGIKLANAVLTGSAVSASGAAISNGGSAASITAGAGGLKLKSKGVVALDGETLQVGTADATVSAAGNISLTGGTLGAGSVHMTAGGSVDVSGIKLTASKTVQLVADKDIVLSGVNITANTFIADASGTIHNGGAPGSLKANGLALVAGKNISMTSTQISIGTGSVSSVHADALLLQELDALGIGPTSAVLNGSFIAGGSVALGDLSVTGHYLMFQGTSVAILGKVTAPTSGLLVQVVPFDTTAAIGVEDKAATTQTFNISNQGFFALFPGDTIAVGDDVESGAVFIGLNGGFTLADKTNLYFDTSGPITGLDLITSTGLVSSLENFVATANDSVVTVGEIDPTAGSTRTGLGDQTDKKHLGQNGDFGDQGQQGGTISNDTNGSGVCH